MITSHRNFHAAAVNRIPTRLTVLVGAATHVRALAIRTTVGGDGRVMCRTICVSPLYSTIYSLRRVHRVYSRLFRTGGRFLNSCAWQEGRHATLLTIHSFLSWVVWLLCRKFAIRVRTKSTLTGNACRFVVIHSRADDRFVRQRTVAGSNDRHPLNCFQRYHGVRRALVRTSTTCR